jgi:hypothetical protein
MSKKYYLLRGLLHGAGVFVYTAVVAILLFNGQDVFGPTRSFLIPLFLLLVFMISASITGLLVLGKPLHLYVNGQRSEALALLAATIGWLIVMAVSVAAGLIWS